MSVFAALAVVVVLGSVGFRAWLSDRPVLDPRYVEFDASPDHFVLNEKRVPLVERYVLELYARDAATPQQQIDLGKPSPTADGLIRIEFASIRMPPIAPGVTFEAAITAVGPFGKGGSNRSNRFTLSGH